MKRFISGFLFGALLFAVPAIANNSKTVEAFYNNIKLSVYGQIVDTEGNEPFIVNGRTYVPARYVAEAMGGVVKWNETENTVEVTRQTPETTATPEPTKLTSDGLEAVYSISDNEYYVPVRSFTMKYSTDYSKPYVEWFIPNAVSYANFTINNKSITVPLYNANGKVSISLIDYENIVIPFLSLK